MATMLVGVPKIHGLSDRAEREVSGLSMVAKRDLLQRLIHEILLPELTSSVSSADRAEILGNAFRDEPGDFTLEEAKRITPEPAGATIASSRS
jgi:hypothetical protein